MLFKDDHMESEALNVHRLHSIVPVGETRQKSVETSLRFRKVWEEFEFEQKGNIRYDLHYNKKPFDIRYTEIFASYGAILVTPCDKKTAYKIYRRGISKRIDTIDFSKKLSGMSDKYIQYEYETECPDKLVILPGSNLIEKTVDKEKLNFAVDEGAFIKPHPLTNTDHIKLLEKEYGKKRVLPRMYSGAILAKEADEVYSSLGSELALLAELSGKEVHDISKEDSDGGGYVWLHKFIRQQPVRSKYLNYLLNTPHSGVFFPESTEEDFLVFLDLWKSLTEK